MRKRKEEKAELKQKERLLSFVMLLQDLHYRAKMSYKGEEESVKSEYNTDQIGIQPNYQSSHNLHIKHADKRYQSGDIVNQCLLGVCEYI